MTRFVWLSRILALLGVALLLAACSPQGPRVHQGSMDLSSWDFQSKGSVPLDGQWSFWWNRMTVNDSLQDPGGASMANIPGYWNLTQSQLPPEGSATYAVKLILPASTPPLSLGVPDVACAWQLYVNGTLWAEQGSASMDPTHYRAMVKPRLVTLPPLSGTVNLAFYVVNSTDRVGGIRDSVVLGLSEAMEKRQLFANLSSVFLIGGLLVMALFNVIIFFLQRQKAANLWLAALATMIALRILVTGPRLAHDFWSELTFEMAAGVAFFSILGSVAAFSFYTRGLFPLWWPQRFFIPFLLYTAAFGLLLGFLPVRTYAEAFQNFYEPVLVVFCLVCLGITFWAMVKRHDDGALAFIGMVFLVAGALSDIAYQSVSVPQGDVIGPFLFVFLVFNTFLLSQQLAKNYKLTQDQARELRELDRLKDDFLARVTHELRTPLHGMAGIVDAFKLGDFGELTERQAYHLDLLEASSRRLLSMVNSILDFSHVKTHRLVSDPRPIQLKQTVDFLLPSLVPHQKPGVVLVNRISDEVPAVLGDEVKLEQVLHHLVLNALQHTETGTVSVEAEAQDQQVHMIIRDTGAGIPTESLARLFSPFEQVADLDTRPTNGLGLGLAISREVIQQMDGRLEVQSKEAVGTVAQIWLPVCPPAKLQYFQAQRLERSAHWDQPPAAIVEPSSAETEATPGPTLGDKPPTVLIVDDEPVNLLVLRTFLGRQGYTVVEATSGPMALTQVTSHVIDLVILDVMMPGMSGYEVCAKIRERFTAARLPVVLLTAKNQVDDLLQGFSAGASDFLTKPFQRDELKARMELHLKVSRVARSGRVTANLD